MSVLLRCARLPFLLLTVSCGWLAVALVIVVAGKPVDPVVVLPTLLGAVCAHLCVNLLNEYQDYSSGLDLATERTAFSGGSGALPAAPEMAVTVLVVALIMAALTMLAGAWLLWQTGPSLLPIGMLGLLIIFCYTDLLNRQPIACLVAPGLGIWLIVTGTSVALTGSYNESIMLVALVPFLLTNNLLLLNQFPDMAADKRVGRRHLPIAFGVHVASQVYILNAILAFLLLIALVHTGHVLPGALLALVMLPVAVMAWQGARKHGESLGAHPIYLASNVLVAVATPAIIGAAILA